MHLSSSNLGTEKKKNRLTYVCVFNQLNSNKKLSHMEKASLQTVRFNYEVKHATTE